jgi:hypothetical protein
MKHLCNKKDIESNLDSYAVKSMIKKLMNYHLIKVDKEKYGYDFVLSKYERM